MKLSRQNPAGFPSYTPPLLVWLAIQLAALLLAAARVPLCANYPLPGEQLAIQLLLVTQVTVSALLFPFLLPSVPGTLAILATTWPALQVAGFLSAAPWRELLAAGVYVNLWLAALGIWRPLLPSVRLQMSAIALATALALGGPVLWYLGAEFSAGPPGVDWARQGAYGPIMGVLAQIQGPAPSLFPWLTPGVLLGLGGALWTARLLPLCRYSGRL